MGFKDDEIKNVAEKRAWIQSKIDELTLELNNLRDLSNILDLFLKQNSFTSADQIKPTSDNVTVDSSIPSTSSDASNASNTSSPESSQFTVHPLSSIKGGENLGNAYLSKSQLKIEPASSLNLNTPPFKSFFLDRILEGMRSKDSDLSKKGELSSNEILNYEIIDDSGLIKEIKISNYGDNHRAKEILNTVSWTFSRMLEKAN